MYLALIFIILGWIVGIFAFLSKGNLRSLILILIALGFSAISMFFIVQQNPIQYQGVNIITPNGNVIVPTFNETYSPSLSTLQFSLVLAEANFFIMVGFVLLIIGLLFFEKGVNKRKRFSE